MKQLSNTHKQPHADRESYSDIEKVIIVELPVVVLEVRSAVTVSINIIISSSNKSSCSSNSRNSSSNSSSSRWSYTCCYCSCWCTNRAVIENE